MSGGVAVAGEALPSSQGSFRAVVRGANLVPLRGFTCPPEVTFVLVVSLLAMDQLLPGYCL